MEKEKEEEREATTEKVSGMELKSRDDAYFRAKNLVEEGVVDNTDLSCDSFSRITCRVGFLLFNLTMVYYLEYTITTSFTVPNGQLIIAVDPTRRKDMFIYKNAYVIFNLCYNIGVCVSRSSLSCFKIRRVGLITLV